VCHAKHVAVCVGYSRGDPVPLQPGQVVLPLPYTIDYGVLGIIIFLSGRYNTGISDEATKKSHTGFERLIPWISYLSFWENRYLTICPPAKPLLPVIRSFSL